MAKNNVISDYKSCFGSIIPYLWVYLAEIGKNGHNWGFDIERGQNYKIVNIFQNMLLHCPKIHQSEV